MLKSTLYSSLYRLSFAFSAMALFLNSAVAMAWERPAKVEVAYINQQGFRIEFTWDREPCFPKGMAVEFEVHVADMSYAQPFPDGKDNSPLFGEGEGAWRAHRPQGDPHCPH